MVLSIIIRTLDLRQPEYKRELVRLVYCCARFLQYRWFWVPMLHDKKPVGVAKPVALETINCMLDPLLLQSDAVGFKRRPHPHVMGL